MLFEFECDKLQAQGCPLSIEPLSTTHSEILTKQCNRCILGTRCLPGVVIIGWKTFFQAAQIHRRLTNNSSAVWLRTTSQNRALSSSLLLLLAFLHGHKQPFFRSSLNFHSRFLLVIGHRDINFTCPGTLIPPRDAPILSFQFEAYNENRQISQDDQSCQKLL